MEIIAAVNIERDSRMISALHVGGIEASTPMELPSIPWMKRAACKGNKDPDQFFRERSEKKGKAQTVVKGTLEGNTKSAKALCRVCRVNTECLLWALEHDEEYGIWGGSTPDERIRMKRYL